MISTLQVIYDDLIERKIEITKEVIKYACHYCGNYNLIIRDNSLIYLVIECVNDFETLLERALLDNDKLVELNNPSAAYLTIKPSNTFIPNWIYTDNDFVSYDYYLTNMNIKMLKLLRKGICGDHLRPINISINDLYKLPLFVGTKINAHRLSKENVIKNMSGFEEIYYAGGLIEVVPKMYDICMIYLKTNLMIMS